MGRLWRPIPLIFWHKLDVFGKDSFQTGDVIQKFINHERCYCVPCLERFHSTLNNIDRLQNEIISGESKLDSDIENTRERDRRAAKSLATWLSFSSQYQNTRLALHNSTMEDMPERERELTWLQEVLQRHLEDERPYFLRISGIPGTGKTACLFKIIQRLNHTEVKSKFQFIYIDCSTTKSAAALYMKIIQQLPIIDLKKSMKNSESIIEEYLKSEHEMLLLVLNKIDQLGCSQLYTIFEWPSLPNSRLILLTVTNVPMSYDGLMSEFEHRCMLQSTSMYFEPYTEQQRFNIISAKLNRSNASDIFTPPAIQMLAGRIAAICKDIRRTLDISRRVVELAESHKIARVLFSNNNNDTNMDIPKQQTDVIEKPFDVKEVVTLLNEVYSGMQNLNQEQETFPLQQKLLFCSLVLILNKHEEVTFVRLHEVYRKVCKKRNICTVDSITFVSLCFLMETQGILRITGKKEPRLSKVSLPWDGDGWQKELDLTFQDKNMIIEIINDMSCL